MTTHPDHITELLNQRRRTIARQTAAASRERELQRNRIRQRFAEFYAEWLSDYLRHEKRTSTS